MIRRIIWTLASLLLVVGLALAVLLYSNWGLRQALRFADRIAPVDIRAEDVRGRLADSFRLEELSIAGPGWGVKVDHAAVSWRPMALLGQRMQIDSIAAGHVRLDLQPSEDGTGSASAGLPPLETAWSVGLVDARVERLSINPAKGDEQVVTDIRLGVELDDGVVSISRLSLGRAPMALAVTGTVDTTADYRHDLTLALSRDAPLAVATAVGNLQATEIAASSGAYGVTAAASIRRPLTDLHWELSADIAEPAPWPDLASATVEAEGDLNHATAKLAGQYADVPFQLDQVHVSWDGPVRLVARRIALPGRNIEGAIDARLLDEGRIHAAVDFAAKLPELPEATGNLIVEGSPETYTAKGSGSLGERLEWVIESAGNRSGLEQVEFRLSGPQEQAARMAGFVTWAPQLSWEAEVDADGLNPAVLWPQWGGAINVHATARGQEQRARIELAEVSGRLRDLPISGHGTVEAATDGVQAFELTLESGDSRVEAFGQWTDRTKALSGEFDVRDLGDLLPSASGLVVGRIRMEDERAASVDVRAEQLTFRQYSAAALTIEGQIAIARGGAIDLKLAGAGLDLLGTEIQQAAVSIRGPADGLELAVDAELQPIGTLDAAAVLTMREAGYEVRLRELSLSSDTYGRWALTRPARFELAPASVMVERSCLRSETGTLCAAVDLREGRAGSMTVDLDAVTAGLFDVPVSAAAGKPIRLEGQLDGAMELQSDGFSISRFSGRVQGGGLKIELPARGGRQVLSLPRLTLTAEGEADRIDAELDASVEGAELGAALSVTGPLKPDPRIENGTLRLEIPSLARFDPLVQRAAELEGRLTAVAEFSGPVAGPVLRGRADAEGLAFRWPKLGTGIHDGSLNLELTPEGRLTGQARLPTQDGVLQVNGEGEVEGFKVRRLTASITGEKVVIADAPDLEVRASPDLNISTTDGAVELRGEIRIDAADIERPLANAVVRPSPDVVLVGEERKVDEGLLQPVDIEVDVVIEDEVRFRGFGLDAGITGRLTIIDRPGFRGRARGELRVGGNYRAYGQQLTIDNGRLIYSGTPLDNPGLRIEAFRQVKDVRAGVRVTGRAANPTVELYSDPAMSDSNILAYLVLGRPLDQATQGESNYLSDAALVLAMKQGSGTTAALGEQLGFEQFGFTVKEDLGGAAFAVGRYLAPNLYLRYSIGLLNPVDLIELQYILSDHWSLETEIGVETRGAVRYRIESGRAKREPAAAPPTEQ